MRSTIILSALAAFAAAAPSPMPQSIDFTKVDAAPDTAVESVPVDVSSQSVSAVPSSSATAVADAAIVASPLSSRDIKRAMKKRDDCAAEPAGTGPSVSDPDTPDAFLAYEDFADTADSAYVPIGYELAFTNLQGSTSQSGYLGFKTLTSYDTIGCSQYCSGTTGCKAFNIYYERDPSVTPADSCEDPASVTNIKCALWGTPICADTATNTGQWREEFEVVITGSNGYNSDALPPSQPGYTGPVELGGAINAPLLNGVDTYMGYTYFSFGDEDGQYPYEDVSLCTASCTAQTAYNAANPAADGTYAPACAQVVAYVLSDDNVPQGQYCALYSYQWDTSYATNVGQYRGDDYWSVGDAFLFNVAS